MQLIIENWKSFLKENISGEDNWQKGKDSDYSLGRNQEDEYTYGKLFLILQDEKDLKIQYPSVGGDNHGLASHAIKHSIELGVDLSASFTMFKDFIDQQIKNNKDLYIKTEKGDFKINKKILDKVAQLYKLSKNQRNEKRKIRQELQKLTGLNRMSPQEIGTIYKDTIYQRLRNLKVSYMLACYDFYYDNGGYSELEKLPYFDSNFITDYENKVDQIVKSNPNGFVKSKTKQGLEVLITKDGFVVIRQGGKIATAMKPKRPKTIDKTLRAV